MKALIAAATVAMLVVAGVAYATIPDSGGVIHGCYQVDPKGNLGPNATLRLVDASAANKDAQGCKNNEKAIAWNQTGPTGPTGATGATGSTGATGANGSAWTPAYGIAAVLVDRGTGSTPWATYSTTLGSPAPFGDSTGGVFRFTCRDTQAPCRITIAGEVSGLAGATMYPRLLIYKQDYFNAGPEVYCEYADGADNNGTYAPVGTSFTPVTMGIGGTLDCPGKTQAYPANGTATEIDVPAGYYDVNSTFYFKAS
jgi:hypothetical protein